MMLGRVTTDAYMRLPIALQYGTLHMRAASVADTGELCFEYCADGTIGMLYAFMSASEKRATIALMYASCKSKIALVSQLHMTCMPSSQLTGPRSVSAYQA